MRCPYGLHKGLSGRPSKSFLCGMRRLLLSVMHIRINSLSKMHSLCMGELSPRRSGLWITVVSMHGIAIAALQAYLHRVSLLCLCPDLPHAQRVKVRGTPSLYCRVTRKRTRRPKRRILRSLLGWVSKVEIMMGVRVLVCLL